MTLVLAFYGFIAGGSVDFLFDGTFWTIIGVLLVLIIIAAFSTSSVSEANKKKRLGLKEEFESKETELDLSDKIGNDRIGLYFDKHKEKVLIASISTEGIDKYYVDKFKKHTIEKLSDNYCAIDIERRSALLVQNKENVNYEVIEYDKNDCNKNETINNDIPMQLHVASLKKDVKETASFASIIPTFILVEEKYGYISIFNNMSVKSFNYINRDYISKKKGESSFVTKKKIGSYVFFMDDFFKVLVIISPLISSHKVFNYSDIINVTYEEDGNTLFSKSMTRTVGGALIGGALIGGAGVIVGGLSGDTSQNKKVQSMNIKILVRSTTTPSVNLPINLKGETFNTKDKKSKKTYNDRIKEANDVKDLISVIIDNSNQQTIAIPTSQKVEDAKPKTGVADELVKLAQLRDSGILSEAEFQEQKKKLLN